MSIKDQVSAEQWKALINAPGAASTFVATASGGGLEIFKEIFSASKFTQQLAAKSGGSGYGNLVDELISAMKNMSIDDAKANAIQYQSQNPVDIRAEMKQLVADGASATAALPDAEGFKRWLIDIAREVAETKTGGVLGFGGQSVIDEKEQAALDELADLLGV